MCAAMALQIGAARHIRTALRPTAQARTGPRFARRCGLRGRPLCEGAHVTFPARHLLCRSCRSLEDDMIAEWIAIYVVVFILCAVIVGRAPTKG
jgi:hypothetical protein